MPFQKGNQLGNRNGRPRHEDTIGDQLREVLKGKGDARKLAKRAVDIALKGEPKDSIRAIQFIAERLGGKPAQSIDVTTDGDPIRSPVQELVEHLRDTAKSKTD